MDIKGNATNTSNSDFEHIKAWENNTNLDYYLSEEHWNFHVNQMLLTLLCHITFWEWSMPFYVLLMIIVLL